MEAIDLWTIQPARDANPLSLSAVRPLALTGLLVSGSLVLAAAYPWSDLVGHTHWSRVAWIPFSSRPLRPLDISGNLLLGVPLGIVAGLTYRRGTLVAGAIALTISFFVETMQLYSHTRFPSATDLLCNVSGAVIAAACVRRYQTNREGRS